jgi:hypothetical protein
MENYCHQKILNLKMYTLKKISRIDKMFSGRDFVRWRSILIPISTMADHVIALGQKEPENINRMIIIRHAFSIHTRVIWDLSI